ncbi:MAG: hypothetical protein EOP86_01920 [Verrucomicrobiaceae bacterium]|nr:MAG: hypothetical protein EOP86_01920 [Verrucomicrobiaceae bacterium]
MANSRVLIPFYLEIALGLILCGLLGGLLLRPVLGKRQKVALWLMAPTAGYVWLAANALWLARCGLPGVKLAWIPAFALAGLGAWWFGGRIPVTRLRGMLSVERAKRLRLLPKHVFSGLAAHPAFLMVTLCCVVTAVIFPHWSVMHSGPDDFHHSMMVRLAFEAGTLPPVGGGETFLRQPYHFSWHLAAAALGRISGTDAIMASAVAARLSMALLVMALGGFAHVLGRSRFSAGAAMVFTVLLFEHPMTLTLFGRWPMRVAMAGFLVLSGILVSTMRQPEDGGSRKANLLIFALLFGSVACQHVRQAVWTGVFLSFFACLQGAALNIRAGRGAFAGLFSWRGHFLPWAVALTGGTAVFALLNIPLFQIAKQTAIAEVQPVDFTFTELLLGGCARSSGHLPVIAAVAGCLLLRKGAVRTRLFCFVTAWWLALALLFKGNLVSPENAFFLPENAKLQNSLWLIIAMALGADAARRRWWFRGQSRRRDFADAMAGLVVLIWLSPLNHSPEELKQKYFPVATADDVRALRRLGKSLRKAEPGVIAVPTADIPPMGRRPMSSGAGGWAPLYLPAGWKTNSITFYSSLADTEAEARGQREVSDLIRRPPAEDTEAPAWLEALKAHDVKAVFMGEIEAMGLYKNESPGAPDEAAAAWTRLRNMPGLKMSGKAGDARVYDIP